MAILKICYSRRRSSVLLGKGNISGKNAVEVSCPEVQHPVAVRYGWGSNPADDNLYNSADLPASPFRTDQWTGITE